MQTTMMPFAGVLDTLLASAEATKSQETEVRREAAARIAALEKTRVRAYRRHHFMRLLGDAARGAPDVQTALASQEAAASERFGWSREATTDQQRDVLTALRPVATLVAATLVPDVAFVPGVAFVPDATAPEPEPVDLIAALDGFEAWYRDRFDAEVWALFDRFTPDLPVTDF